MKRLFCNHILTLLLLAAVLHVQSAGAQSADGYAFRPLTQGLPAPDLGADPTADISTAVFLEAGLLKPVAPLSAESLFVAEHARWNPVEMSRFHACERSELFKGSQLALPLTLFALSTFGTWDKNAKIANKTIQSQFLKWRGGTSRHFDDYVQYVPIASYVALGFTGARHRHNFKERVVVLGTSYLAMFIMTQSLKYTIREPRPNNIDERNSYPSGHTATAFMGAELVRREYGTGYGVAAYAVACTIGIMRMYNDRHWFNDVLAGAGIGILSAQIGYWMLPYTRRLFGMSHRSEHMSLAVSPFYDSDTKAVGGGVAIMFH